MPVYREQTDDDIVENCVNTCIAGNVSEDEAQIPETEIKIIPMKLALNALKTQSPDDGAERWVMGHFNDYWKSSGVQLVDLF
ncbi:hypothetical protein EVAR_62244_1 [Eumeta japonica]|uniref:Uncharacterized protein n=1 Tax=Eumeta variegata TaxID=151549 RepID=A0A4C1ZFR6_EUMVA|nr:hypothetical protein EVAR_62244_1 [Eumeta japonica]